MKPGPVASVPADVGAQFAPDPYLPASGNAGYHCRHYDLDLTYRPVGNLLNATATIEAVAEVELARFSLDLADLRVGKVTVDGRPARRFTHRGGKLTITAGTPIAAGDSFVVTVTYSGRPHPRRGVWGEIGWEELTEGVLVASQPDGAPSWFPCNDHPSDKASYRIAVTVDAPFTAVANGILRERRTRSSRTRFVFEQSEPTATYLVTIQIGHYETVELASSPVPQLVTRPARLRAVCTHDLGRQAEMMEFFSECFGPYPFAQYGVVVTDDPLEIPVEAQGLSIFGANHMDGRRWHERLVAHELAHSWFGNSLTVRTWQHIWLNEGFACYAEWLWSQQAGRLSTERHARKYWDRLAGLPQDLIIADPGPRHMFDDRLYKRGALTLHALRSRLGDAAFFDLLRTWTARYRHANVRTEDFQEHVAAYGAGLDGLLTAWLWRPELPPRP